jgi:hypothetical protein
MDMAQTLTARTLPSHRDHGSVLAQNRSCGHARHVGGCPECQRMQLARWNAQLAEVSRTVSGTALSADLGRGTSDAC